MLALETNDDEEAALDLALPELSLDNLKFGRGHYFLFTAGN